MTPKQTALFNVAWLIGTAIVSGFVIAKLLTLFGPVNVGIGACVLMLAYLVKMVYDMELDKAERLNKLD